MRDDPDLFGPIISRACAGAVAMTVPCDKLFEFDALEFGPQFQNGEVIHSMATEVAGFTFLADGLLRPRDVHPMR